MFDRAYRQRLEADLAQWEANGVIAPAVLAAIRGALPPLAPRITISVVVAIVGGLLIAAAFLAFVAANWTELARLLRFAILLAGMAAANGLGLWFARAARPILADLCVAVGTIIFGAGIALVGQMYHLGEDFAGGMLLWAVGALAAAGLTGSRGALAVALAAGCIWSWMRVSDTDVPHLPFIALWLVAASLALTWNSRVAWHLVSIAALPWWIAAVLLPGLANSVPFFALANGAALLLGGGIALAATPWERIRGAGSVLSTYGAFMLACIVTLEIVIGDDRFRSHVGAVRQPPWAIACGISGVSFALIAAAVARKAGAAAAAVGLVLLTAAVWMPSPSGEPWLAYTVVLGAVLCVVISGVLDAARPRIVAGWLGVAGTIAAITWSVKGSLLHRSAFLAAAGIAAVVLAMVLHRLLPKTDK